MITTDQIVAILIKHADTIPVGEDSVTMLGKRKFPDAAEEIKNLIKTDSEKIEPKY